MKGKQRKIKQPALLTVIVGYLIKELASETLTELYPACSSFINWLIDRINKV
jgi:hypothetical protein